MNALNESLLSPEQITSDSKKQWNASLPYPSWPFGTVPPEELKRWGRLHSDECTKRTIDNAEDALL